VIAITSQHGEGVRLRFTPRRMVSPAFLVILVILALGPSRMAAQSLSYASQKSISVTSELVAVPVSVTDSNGNFVPGLNKDNFQILENNHRREIALFEQEDTPVSIGLLIDHSGSMESKLPHVVTSISGFTHFSNSQDEMFVVNFGDHAKLQLMGGKPFTGDPFEISQAVSVAAAGRTALYDAVSEGLDHLRYAHWQKRALLIVSDGGDNASAFKYSEVLAQARRSQSAIYAIGLVGDWREEENPRILLQLSHDTGGLAFFPHTGAEIVDATRAIARDLRQQYLIAFAPGQSKHDDSFHKIQVRVIALGHGKLHVRTRAGYFVDRNIKEAHSDAQSAGMASGS
jgi:Ca-activated chloride channel family protein